MNNFYTIALGLMAGASLMWSPSSFAIQPVGQSTINGNEVPKIKVKAPRNLTQYKTTISNPSEEPTNMVKDCMSYYAIWGVISARKDNGGVVHMIKSDSNEIWLDNGISWLSVPTWYKGTLSDDGRTISISEPQEIYQQDDEPLYILPMKLVNVDDGEESYQTYEASDEPFVLELQNGKWIQKNFDDHIILGLAIHDKDEYLWTGYGDYMVELSPNDFIRTELPDNSSIQEWTCYHDGIGNHTLVAIYDGSIYVKGMFTEYPEEWVEGKTNGNTVAFKCGQYLGPGEDLHYGFIYGGTIEDIYYPDYDMHLSTPVIKGNLEFSYDAANKTLTTPQSAMVAWQKASNNYDQLQAHTVYSNLAIKYLPHEYGTAPSSPYDLYDSGFDEDDGYGYIRFNLSPFDANGALLDITNLYYSLYFNGDLYTFSPNDYIYLTEPMTLIPYSYADTWDFYVSDADHQVFYFENDIKNIGVQSVYIENETEFRSPIVSLKTSSSPTINDIDGETLVYYDMYGRITSHPGKGVFVGRTQCSDGSEKTVKIIK